MRSIHTILERSHKMQKMETQWPCPAVLLHQLQQERGQQTESWLLQQAEASAYESTVSIESRFKSTKQKSYCRINHANKPLSRTIILPTKLILTRDLFVLFLLWYVFFKSFLGPFFNIFAYWIYSIYMWCWHSNEILRCSGCHGSIYPQDSFKLVMLWCWQLGLRRLC